MFYSAFDYISTTGQLLQPFNSRAFIIIFSNNEFACLFDAVAVIEQFPMFSCAIRKFGNLCRVALSAE
jgi:hypothetical protein